MKSESFRPAIVVTVVYLGAIIIFRASDVGPLLWSGDLNELGDFLAGVFTPAAFGWLIYGHFLQWKALQQQREQAEADRQRSMPCFHLEKDDSLLELPDGAGGFEQQDRPDPDRFILRNIGGDARNLEITIGKDEGALLEPPPLLGKNMTHPVYIYSPFVNLDFLKFGTIKELPTCCIVRFTSERDEKFEQAWAIRFSHDNAPVKIQELSKGPIPL